MSDALVMFLQGLDLVGVFFNAICGAVIARSARLDLVGLATLAIMSGLGGGMIRDTLLQAGPPIALVDWRYLTTALAGAAVVVVARIGGRWWNRVFAVMDALAVGCWAAVGAVKALALGHGWLAAVLLGTITAVGGGFVRDMVLRQVPAILGGNTLYATWAVAASAVAVTGYQMHQTVLGSLAATVLAAGLILVSRKLRWALPQGEDAATVGQAVARMLARRRRAGEERREDTVA